MRPFFIDCPKLSLLAALLTSVAPVAVLANPVDGVVSAGAATISSVGSTLTVNQSTDKAVIDWRGFDIGVGETTQFQQPNSNSLTVNRVGSGGASQIYGTLTANGNIVIINPNGVVFHSGSQVDVNGMVATTADVSNADAMAGKLNFTTPGNPNASVENHGTITAKDAGLVGLVAPNVINSGVITAKLGRIHLASGDSATVDLYGDGLVEVKASDALTSQLVKNTGTLNADGGTIALTAAAGRETVDSLIQVSGTLNARSIGNKNGRIYIHAEGSNAVANNVAADKGVKTGNSVVLVDGTLDVSGKNPGETGGKVEILGDHIALIDHAVIDATGAQGGGIVHVGGQYLGLGDTPTASITIMEAAAKIDASALLEGDGGEVIVYADNSTEFYGTIHANGAGDTGNGGFVETSGRIALLAFGDVRAIAGRNGKAGTWLLDPADITITAATNSGSTSTGTNPRTFTATATGSQVSAATIKSSLDMGATVIIQTSNDAHAGNGDIFVNAAISTASFGSLTLRAYRNIEINAGITLAAGLLTLSADNTSIGAGTVTIKAVITKTTGTTLISGTDLIITGAGRLNNTGSLTITGSSSNVTMGIGTGAAGMMNINDTELGLLGSSTTLNFGTTSYNLGNVEINTGYNFGSKSITIYSNGNITLAGTLTKTTGINTTYAFNARGNITNSNSAGIVATTGYIDLAFYSDRDASGAGYINLTNASLLTNSGSVQLISNGQSITLSGTMGGTTFLSSGNGAISIGTLDFDTDSTRRLYALAGTGTVTTTGIIGGTNKLLSMDITADDVDIGANIYGTDTLVIQTDSDNRVMNIGTGTPNASTFNLSAAEIGRLQDGWSSITIGRTDSTVSYNLGSSNWYDEVSFLNDIGYNVSGTITSSDSNGITFSTGDNYFNAATMTAGGLLSLGGTIYDLGGSTLASTNNNVAFAGDFYANNTTVNAANGTVTFNVVGLQTAARNLTVSANAITMNSNFSGTFGTVNLTSNNALALRNINAATINLNAGGAVTQVASTALTATNLSLQGAGAYTLTNSTNTIGIVAANTTNAISVTNGNSSLAVGTVNGINGITNTSTNAVTLSAYRDITVSSAITLQGGALTLGSNNTGAGGSITVDGTIQTNGGNVTLGGGVDPTTGYAVGVSTSSDPGVLIVNGGSIQVGGGNVVIRGQGSSNAATCSNQCYGISINNGSVTTTGTGTITLDGIGGGDASNWAISGIQIHSGSTLSSVNGAIILYGRSGASASNSGVNIGTATISSANNDILIYIPTGYLNWYKSPTNPLLTAGRNLVIRADAFGGTAADIDITAGNTITVAPYSNRELSIGASVGGTTNIGNDLLARFTAPSLVFGSVLQGDNATANTSNVTVNTSNDFGDKNVTFLSGGNIALAGTLTKGSGAGTANYIFRAYGAISNSGSAGVSATNGSINLTLDSDYNNSGGEVITLNGGTFNTNGGNLTLNDATTLGGNVTFTGGAGTISTGTINGAHNLTSTAAAYSFGSDWGASTALGAVSLTSPNSIALPSIRAASIFVQTTGATSDITLTSGETLTASAAGDAIRLVAARNFINNAATPFSLTGGGRWLVYSTSPTANTLNGLTSGFVRYGCTYGGSCPTGTSIPASDNGLIYTYQPTLTITPIALAAITAGDPVPSLTGYGYTFSGYLTSAAGSDASADVRGGAINGSTTYTTSSPAGTYTINYASGTLTSELGYAFSYANNASGFVVNAGAGGYVPPPTNNTVVLPDTVKKVSQIPVNTSNVSAEASPTNAIPLLQAQTNDAGYVTFTYESWQESGDAQFIYMPHYLKIAPELQRQLGIKAQEI